MIVKVINKSGNPLPAYATALSAGLDVRADNAERAHGPGHGPDRTVS